MDHTIITNVIAQFTVFFQTFVLKSTKTRVKIGLSIFQVLTSVLVFHSTNFKRVYHLILTTRFNQSKLILMELDVMDKLIKYFSTNELN
jgi:hypothetical protein